MTLLTMQRSRPKGCGDPICACGTGRLDSRVHHHSMRIALVITELYPGGAERCLTNLAIYLRRSGHAPHVVSLWSLPPASRRQLVDMLLTEGIEVESIAWDYSWQTPAALRRLRRRLSELQPDITQSFLFHANVACAWACRGLHTQLVGGARVVQPNRWRRLLQRWASGRMQRLVCVSQDVAESCHRTERIPQEKLTVIPNGIAVDRSALPQVRWEAFGLPKSARVILYVGRLDSQKGLLEFMERADSILSLLPDHHLVLMGEGPLADALQHRMTAAQHRDHMHLVGWHPDAIAWMQAAEMLILPAKYEGMPNVVLEAMAVARPVVCFHVEGIRELLGDAAGAELQTVPAGDYDSFARSVVRIASDPGLQRELGEANLHRIDSRFSLATHMQSYVDTYTHLLQGSSQ
ncbi:MAG: glycosyltransferase [Planctomycetota bacterium]|nr:MAG: glycosyltransferase [Planctomycetota bacterium]